MFAIFPHHSIWARLQNVFQSVQGLSSRAYVGFIVLWTKHQRWKLKTSFSGTTLPHINIKCLGAGHFTFLSLKFLWLLNQNNNASQPRSEGEMRSHT